MRVTIKRNILIFLILFEVLIPNSVFAKAILNIAPSSLYVSLHTPGRASITYTVQNNTAQVINKISVNPTYQTTGNINDIFLQNDNCTSSTLNPSASCTFQLVLLSQNQPGSFTLRPRVCGYNGLICSVPLSSKEVKVKLSYLTSISITPINASILSGTIEQYNAIGTYDDGTTQDITNSVTWSSISPSVASITSTGLATAIGSGSDQIKAVSGSISSNSATITVISYAYITNGNSSILSFCPVNPDGTLQTCSPNTHPTFNGTSSIALYTFASIAYVANYNNNTISVCTITSSGTLGSCFAISDPTFNGPSNISINSAATFAYIVNYNNSTVSVCPISADKTYGPCTASNPGGTFSRPDALRLNNQGNLAYISDTTAQTISRCSINPDGSLGTCTASSDPTFSGPAALSLNAANTILYVGNNNGTVSLCPVNPNGTLNACTALSSSTFVGDNFGKITLNTLNTLAYVVNQTNNYVSLCPINADGTFGVCTTSNPGGTFNGPEGIDLS
jgi:6-phosphogluconolactonase (cycloisomerase 2 family)